MKYSKQALSFIKQADLLPDRGLMADRDTLIGCLRSVSHYRLGAYWYTFRILPLWMACELMTFGGTLTLFRHADVDFKRHIAHDFGVADKVLESWLVTLNFIRNICAHHGRLRYVLERVRREKESHV